MKPYQERFDLRLELFNEMCIYTCALSYMLMTDFQAVYDFKVYAAWLLVGVTIFSFLVNTLVFFVMLLKDVYSKLSKNLKKLFRKTVRL